MTIEYATKTVRYDVAPHTEFSIKGQLGTEELAIILGMVQKGYPSGKLFCIRVCLVNFYLDWVNNYITVSKMAEHYYITEGQCSKLIDVGRKLYEEVKPLPNT